MKTDSNIVKNLVAACLGLALANVAVAAAAEVAISVDTGVGHSDNITRADGTKTGESLGTVGLVIDAIREEGRLTGSLAADTEYLSYFDNTYDDDLYGRIDLDGDYAIVGDVFSWMLSDSWGQIRSNPFAAPNPGNQENVNSFTTGPDLNLQFGSRTHAVLSGRYSMTTFAGTPRDYSKLGGGFGLVRKLSELSDAGLNAYAYRVEYDNKNLGSSYDLQELALTFNTAGAKTSLAAEAGVTAVHDAGETSQHPLFRLTLERKLGVASRAKFRVGQEFSDSGSSFVAGEALPPGWWVGSPSDALATGRSFRSTYAGFGWSTNKLRTTLVADVTYRQEEHPGGSAFDRKVLSLYGAFTRHMSEKLTFDLGGGFDQEKFDDGSLDDERLRLDAGLKWQLTQRTFLGLTWYYFDGGSNSVVRRYSEYQFWLRAGYNVR